MEINLYGVYWVVEEYYQDYYESYLYNFYIVNVSKFKVEKVKKVFVDIIKLEFKK